MRAPPTRPCAGSIAGPFAAVFPRQSHSAHRQRAAPQRQLTRTSVAALENPATQLSSSLSNGAAEPLEFDEDDNLNDEQQLYARFEALLTEHDFNFKRGDKVMGTVFTTDQRGAYVDIGAKGQAFVPMEELSLSKVDRVGDVLTPGQRREFVIIRDNGQDREIRLSLKQIEFAVAWQRLRQLQEEDATLEALVMSVNRGGLLVEAASLRGFIPTSHVSVARVSEELVGTRMKVKLLEVDEETERLVFSNRRASSETQMAGHKVGDVVVGTVQAVKPYGAFIDVGGLNGLLHISQISHDRVTNVENVLSEGDKLKVMILSRDQERGRVSLSTKKLEPTPGDMLRDPALVYARADEMAAEFRKRVAEAEAAGYALGSPDDPAAS